MQRSTLLQILMSSRNMGEGEGAEGEVTVAAVEEAAQVAGRVVAAVVEAKADWEEEEQAAQGEKVEAEEQEVGGGGVPRGGLGQPFANPNFTQPRVIVPPFPESATTNQQVLYALAAGTGGFPIFNTNDLLTGLQKIAAEQNEYYLLGFAPVRFGGGKLPHAKGQGGARVARTCARAADTAT